MSRIFCLFVPLFHSQHGLTLSISSAGLIGRNDSSRRLCLDHRARAAGEATAVPGKRVGNLPTKAAVRISRNVSERYDSDRPSRDRDRLRNPKVPSYPYSALVCAILVVQKGRDAPRVGGVRGTIEDLKTVGPAGRTGHTSHCDKCLLLAVPSYIGELLFVYFHTKMWPCRSVAAKVCFCCHFRPVHTGEVSLRRRGRSCRDGLQQGEIHFIERMRIGSRFMPIGIILYIRRCAIAVFGWI